METRYTFIILALNLKCKFHKAPAFNIPNHRFYIFV